MDQKPEILIVDDDVGLASNLQDILEEEGYNIAVAHDGQAAIDFFGKNVFDLVFIDIKIPDISGVELIDKLTKLSLETMYIIITGHATLETAIQAVRHKNVIAYKTKPLDMNRLLVLTGQVIELKRAEHALRESEEMLSSFMDSATDAFALYDSQLILKEINKTALNMFPSGIKKDDVIGKNILEIEPNLKETGRYHQYLKVVKKGEPFFFEEVIPDPKFGDIHLAVKAFTVGDGLGLIMTDITERVRAEGVMKQHSLQLEDLVKERTKELKSAQEELVRKGKLAVLGQLASGVGHEIRNPLGVISNAIYYLKIVLSDADENIKEYMGIIASEIRNCDKIVSDLLGFSRTRSAEREKIAFSELVNQALEKQPPPEGVKVITDIAPDLPPVYIDPRQMGQVLSNLITNAFQAMPEGGKLTIRAQAKKDKLSLSITDTGCGISEENMKKVFEPLFTNKAKGIGLGLAISKNLVEVNRGSIEVKSREGKGSAFTVILPTKEENS